MLKKKEHKGLYQPEGFFCICFMQQDNPIICAKEYQPANPESNAHHCIELHSPFFSRRIKELKNPFPGFQTICRCSISHNALIPSSPFLLKPEIYQITADISINCFYYPFCFILWNNQFKLQHSSLFN